MRAALIEELGQPPRLSEVVAPERRDGQALVEITAAPIDHVDLSIAAGGFYAGDPVEHEVLPLDRIGDAWKRQARSPHRKLVLSP